ncbi:Serine/threonine protein kinase, catalytic domain containing protein [Pandoravirus celtis]|uniref:non-specific serine/threonine protein kinase n=1 Tax=Pandoravirus celtis TaxID=2568002 RepID=A0A4D6EKB2_9VIRU|nr:Serine/threonine protein kinase, catalytic domain containing protein [Pandoravirus celtis]
MSILHGSPAILYVIVALATIVLLGARTDAATPTSVTLIGDGGPTAGKLIRALAADYQYTRDDIGLVYIDATPADAIDDYAKGQADFVALHTFTGVGARRAGMRFAPMAATALVAAHNAPPCPGHTGPLVVTCDLLGLLWSGAVTTWSDARVTALNPACSTADPAASNVTLVMVGPEGDDVEDAFMRALADCSPDFAAALAIAGHNTSRLSPANTVRIADNRMAWLETAPAGALTFAAAWETTMTVPAATLLNATGHALAPDTASVSAALLSVSAAFNDGLMTDPASTAAGAIVGIRAAGAPGAWPLCAMAWVGVDINGTGRGSVQAFGSADCSYTQELLRLLVWAQVNSAVGTNSAAGVGYVPVPFAWVYTAVNALSDVRCGGLRALSESYMVAMGEPPAQIYQRMSYSYTAGLYRFKFFSGRTVDGIQAMLANQVDLSSITALPTRAQMDLVPDVVLLPMQIGAIGPIYSVPELVGRAPLYFDWSVLTGIYLGEIRTWDHPRIAALNPELAPYLPAGREITIVYQVLPSSVAAHYTHALALMNATFAAEVGYRWDIQFPVMFDEPNRTVGIVGMAVPPAVQAHPYSFTFWPTHALQGVVGVVAGGMVNPAGNRVLPDTASLASTLADFAPAMAAADIVLPDVDPVAGPGARSWPVAMYNYLMLRTRTMVDSAKAKALVDWIYWAQSTSEARALAEQNYVVMCSASEGMMARVLAIVVNITVDGVPVSSLYGCVAPNDGRVCSDHGTCIDSVCVCTPPWTGVHCATDGTLSASTDSTSVIIPAVVAPVVAGLGLLIIVAALVIVIVMWRARRRLHDDDWEIDPTELDMGDQLGAGGYGTVHKAKWKGTEVAVKLIGATPTREALDRFRDEVRVMTALRHPNVVLFMAACTKAVTPCIVMEYMALGSLHDLLANELITDLPPALRVRLAYQAAKGMHFLHSSGVVHRDLKSMNLLLDAKWNLKVSDFGLTRLAGDHGSRTSTAIEGTVQWMAPEILAGDHTPGGGSNGSPTTADMVPADVYAFGVVLWELLTRQQPYAGLSQAAVAVAVLRDDARPRMPPTGTIMPPTFVDFERLVVDCWNRDPMMRPAFLEAMTRLSTIIDGDASSSTGGRYTGTSSSSSPYAGSSGGGGAQAGTDEPSLLADSVRGFDRSSPAATPITVHVGHKRAPVADDQGPVTVVFTDVHRADTLWDEVPRAMKDALVEHNLTVRAAVAAHGGYESPFGPNRPAGEGTFCLVFARADDALDFCRTAQTALLDAKWPPHLLHHADACEETGGNADDAVVFRGLRVRMGVHTGRVRATMDPLTRRYSYTGPAVEVAAALACVAQGGRVLVSVDARRTAESLVGSSPPSSADADIDNGRNSEGVDGRLVFGRLATPTVVLRGGRATTTACELYTVPGRHFGGAHLGPDADHDRGDDNHADDDPYSTDDDNSGLQQYSDPSGETDARAMFLGTSSACRSVLDYEEIVVGEQIGAGTYGVVHRGKWKGIDVAVKRFVKQRLDEHQRIDFRAEVAVLSEAHHPNIVLFIGACVRAPNVCIVTEWVRGGNLRQLLGRQTVKLLWRARLSILRDIALGLDYLHTAHPDMKIMHRDLKSSNVLVAPDDSSDGAWTAKLADFGFARAKADMATMTRCGTPAWTAPEIIRGETYSEKADIYSLGVVMWEVLTRRQPYADANFMRISLDVLDGKRPDVPADCPPAFAQLMQRCWHRKAHKRPSAADVAAGLLAMANTQLLV